MGLFEQIIITENEKASQKERAYVIQLINKTFNEWRKTNRRINAVDIITTTVNRIAKLHPDAIQFLNDEMKKKVALIIMRCLDNPVWKPLGAKEKLYDKLFPLIKPLEGIAVDTGTGGTLKEVIMTRMSANLAMQDENNKGKVMVCYEPSMPIAYSRYLVGDHKAEKIYKMQALSMPSEFSTLIDILKIDLEKAYKKHSS